MKLTESTVIRFPLRHESVHADFMTRLFLFLGVGMGAMLLAVWLLSGSDFDWVWVVFVIGFPAVGIWAGRRDSIGEAQVSGAGIRVRSRAFTQSYPWEDIAAINAASAEQANTGLNRAVFRALGVDLSHRVVVVELKRRARKHLVLNRIGTRAIGIPIAKRIGIEPEDVDGLVEAANRFVTASRS